MDTDDRDAANERQRHETLCAGYSALCDAYHRIDDFRARLLAFLPAAFTGALFLLRPDVRLPGDGEGLYRILGFLGLFATVGLFTYELGGMIRCRRFIEAGKRLEEELHLKSKDGARSGMFSVLPTSALSRGPAVAAWIIYPTVLVGWASLLVMDLNR